MATGADKHGRDLRLMCARCQNVRILELKVLPDGRVWTLEPGNRLGTRKARELPDYGGLLSDDAPIDRHEMSRPTRIVGDRGSILLTCQRCGFEMRVRGERLENIARDAASAGIERLTVTRRGDIKPFTELTYIDRRGQTRRAPQG